MEDQKTKKEFRFRLWDLSFLWHIAIAIAALFVLLSFVGFIYPVTTDGMKVQVKDSITLETKNVGFNKGDQVLVSTFIYKFKEPYRNEVVRYSKDGKNYYYGRIIGLPGEKIYIDDTGLITINDVPYKWPFSKQTKDQFQTVSQADERIYPITVPENAFFVLCDNPSADLDSRYSVIEEVARDELNGKVLFVFSSGGSWHVVE